MSTAVQRRRGTTAQHASFAGLEGELTVDTTKDTLVVHDGATTGGRPLLREDQTNLPTSAPTTGIYNASGSLGVATSGTGRLFVDASGRVGVGATPGLNGLNFDVRGDALTSSPNLGVTAFDFISGPSFTGTFIRQSGSTATGSTSGLSNARLGSLTFQNGSTGLIRTNGTAPIVFATTDTERLRITSAGLVGIGTSAPLTSLDVRGTVRATNATNYVELIGAEGAIELTRTDGGPFIDFKDVLADDFDVRVQQRSNGLAINTGGNGATAERVRIDSSGRVGIGTPTPGLSGSNRTAVTINAPTGQLSILEFGVNNTLTGYLYSNASQTTLNSQNTPLTFDVQGERARIDSSGRLLVGTSTSRTIAGSGGNNRLQIESPNSGIAGFSIITNRGDGIGPVIYFGKSRGPANGGTTIVANGDVLGDIRFAGADGTDIETMGARIRASVDGTPGANNMPGRLEFFTTADGGSPTERMRITNTGYLKASNTGLYFDNIGTYHELRNSLSNQSTAVFSCSSASSPYGVDIRFPAVSPDNNTNYFLLGSDNTVNRIFIYSDGDVWTSDAGTLTSDETLKRDITDASPKLADVMNLRVRNFYWEQDYHPNKQDKKLIGFIAQEFEEVFPALVSEHRIKGGEPIIDENGNNTGETTPEVFKKGIKEAKLVPILVKALQEAVERIEALEAKVAALESA